MMKKRGFTLLEIIAVISLIVIVSSVVVPAYTKITDRQRLKTDMSTALELSQMAKTYYVDYKNKSDFALDKVNDYILEMYEEMPVSKYNNATFSVTLKDGGKVDVSVGGINLVVNDKLVEDPLSSTAGQPATDPAATQTDPQGVI